jgi:glycosyltransferase involved in cell wall biosynthesis
MQKKLSPFISIVIPTYNHAKFLTQALSSVRNQTYHNWEIILIDNHSKDDTDKIVKNFNDKRIRFFKIHNHGIIAKSRNKGIKEARGDWIAFLDSDDIWYPNKLMAFVQALKNENSFTVFCTNEIIIDIKSGSRKLLKFGPYCDNFYQKLLTKGNCLSPSASVVKRSFMIKNKVFFRENKKFITAEDYDFWMNLARFEAKFKFLNSVQGEYIIHSKNKSSQIERHSEAIYFVLEDHINKLQQFEPRKDLLLRHVKARLFMSRAKLEIINGKILKGFFCILKALNISIKGSIKFILVKYF